MNNKKLKFKKEAESISLTEDFFYMISLGGWCDPEKYLEKEDAERVHQAIDIILQFEEQGIEEGFFEEM